MKTNKHKRSGSALVVVLGMLAVIMIMAIAFAIYMRTERAGTTNLRHSFVAKQMMQSSIARVMQAIDESFGEEDAGGGGWIADPKGNWPAPPWSQPYLTSHEPTWEERARNARILTSDVMMHLTPSQLALARTAKIDWVSIRSGISAEWEKDSIMGRFAFIAFDVSGLHDMNLAGADEWGNSQGDRANEAYEARKGDFATNAVNYHVWDSVFFNGRGASGGGAYAPVQADYKTFVQARAERPFMSMADLWRRLDVKQGPQLRTSELEKIEDFPPDLFTSFSMSLEGLAPDYSMKLPIVDLKSLNSDQKSAYAKFVLATFKKVFDEAGDSREFMASKVPRINGAELATQALIDYIDDDDIPAGGMVSFKRNNDGTINFDADNPEFDESSGNESDDYYLNFPCTEPVPMVSHAFAWFEVEETARYRDEPDQRKWYTEYTVTLSVMCEARYLNDHVPENLKEKRYQLKIEYDFMDFLDLAFDPGSGLWPAPPNPDWVIPDFPAFVKFFGESHEVSGDSKKMTGPGDVLHAPPARDPEVFTFKVRAYDKVDGDGNWIGKRAFSQLEENGSVAPTLRTDIRITATVLNDDGKPVQQVPCPILANDRRDPDLYRIRVAPGIYHKEGERTGNAAPYEYGWALCLDPRFAYNTEVVKDDFDGTEGYCFWIDNALNNEQLVPSTDWAPSLIGRMLRDKEMEGAIADTRTIVVNRLIDDVFFSKDDPAEVKAFADVWNAGMEIYPDAFRTWRKGGTTFLRAANDTARAVIMSKNDKLRAQTETHIANRPMVSPGELGNLVIGPWETLSLFATFKPASPNEKAVFHRALDYFCMGQARYPTTNELTEKSKLSDFNNRHLSTVQSGRVNLNPPRLVLSQSDVTPQGAQKVDGDGYPMYNVEPLAAVLAGAAINQDMDTTLDIDMARDIAEAFYDQAKAIEKKGKNRGTVMISRLSDLGGQCDESGDPVASAVLDVLMEYAEDLKIIGDAHREALLVNSVNALTTRGQSFLVVIRAEAYSPRYGSDSPDHGTTLSTSHAIVELWRDPEPARKPDGSLYMKSSNPDEATPSRAWVIRSIRWF